MDQILASVRAAGDLTRLRLLAVLSRSELTVTELTQILAQSQPRISRHLKLMCEAGLLNRFQEGSWVFYRLADRGDGADLARFLVDRLSPEDPTMARDFERLEAVRRARADAASAYFRSHAERWSEIRSLHIPERQVEKAMLEILGRKRLGNVLDLGTGTGQVLKLVANRAERAVGVDLSREMLSIARTALDAPGLGHVQVRQGDIFSLEMDEGTFDLVTIHLVLHYLDDPGRAVSQAARMLKPGGRLLIADFAPHSLEFLRDEHKHRRLGFGHEEIVSLLRAAKLELIDTRHLPPTEQGELTVVLWLARALPVLPEAPAEQGNLEFDFAGKEV